MELDFMRQNPFIPSVLTKTEEYADIEAWNEAVLLYFRPFVRRRSVLVQHRALFRAELVNLARIVDQPNLSKALLDAVKMCRRAIYAEPLASYAHQITVHPDSFEADGRWLSLCASANPLGEEADIVDRVAEYMNQIDAMAEACLRPRIRFLFGFAHRLANGTFPASGRDFGKYIDQWPNTQAPALKTLFRDPVFGLAVSQWRNIGAHRSYRRKDSVYFEATYGHSGQNRIQFTLDQLKEILIWVRDLLYVCRMAEVIIYIEFMPELKHHGLPEVAMRFDANMLSIAHSLRMVGFTYVGENRRGGELAVLFADDQSRPPKDAIIHLSQCLDTLAMAVDMDLELKDVVREVGIGLVDNNNKVYAWALVAVDVALKKLGREMSLKSYVEQVQFGFS